MGKEINKVKWLITYSSIILFLWNLFINFNSISSAAPKMDLRNNLYNK